MYCCVTDPPGCALSLSLTRRLTAVRTTPANSVKEAPSPSVQVSPDEGAMLDKAPSVTYVGGNGSEKHVALDTDVVECPLLGMRHF